MDFMEADDDDIIVCVDTDCIMQRPFTDDEIALITPDKMQIIATYPRSPPQTLREVTHNLGFKHTDRFQGLDHFEFCGAFLVARAATFRLLANMVVYLFDDLVDVNSHHAGIQFLISYCAYKYLDVKIVSNVFQVGDWYLNDYALSRKGRTLMLNGEMVIFNHTKFNPFYNLEYVKHGK